MKYLDFEIELRHLGEKLYRVIVHSSPEGQAECEFHFPKGEEVQEFLSQIGGTGVVRRGVSDGEAKAKEFGSILFDAMFRGQVLLRWRDSYRSLKDEQGLRVRLRMGNAPQLQEFPWEYLYYEGFFLCAHKPIAMVRNLDGEIKPLAKLRGPLRILVAIASPRTLPQLDAEREWNGIENALKKLIADHTIELTRVSGGTTRDLRETLDQHDYHVLHFIGHGNYDSSTGKAYLAFEDENGDEMKATGDHLGQFVADQRSLKIAVLNSCKGAYADGKSPFSGVAQSLIQKGVPAVVAMQSEITDGQAIVFAEEFYKAVARGKEVDEAITSARRALYTHKPGDLAWGTPVLYRRGESGHLFRKLDRGEQRPDRCDWSLRDDYPVEGIVVLKDGVAWQSRGAVSMRVNDDDRLAVQKFRKEQPYGLGMAPHPDGDFYVATCDDILAPKKFELSRFDSKKKRLTRMTTPLEDKPLAFACWPDENSIVVVFRRGYVRYAIGGGLVPSLISWNYKASAATFSEAQCAILNSEDHTVLLYTADFGSTTCSLTRSDEVHLLALSRDGKRLAVADHGHGVTVFDTQTLTVRRTIVQDQWITALALNGDGTSVAFATGDSARTIHICDIAENNHTTIGKTGHLVMILAFSSKEPLLYSGDADGWIRGWSLDHHSL